MANIKSLKPADSNPMKFLVDVSFTTTNTYEVEAESAEEARERYPEVGVPVHSESSGAVVEVHEQ